jgi:ADP-heptose:LPS heptosyltransferase
MKGLLTRSVAGVHFISLQIGAGECPNIPGMIDWTDQLTDFADTAALLANLDLLITIDTAAAHLAGAMGKPAWVLLSHAPDWRWMLDRADSPWYPSLRLFRQPTPGDWATPIAEIARELESVRPINSV